MFILVGLAMAAVQAAVVVPLAVAIPGGTIVGAKQGYDKKAQVRAKAQVWAEEAPYPALEREFEGILGKPRGKAFPSGIPYVDEVVPVTLAEQGLVNRTYAAFGATSPEAVSIARVVLARAVARIIQDRRQSA